VNIFKVLLNWGKIAAGLASAIPVLEEFAENDHETAGAMMLAWGDVQEAIREVKGQVPADLKEQVDPLLDKLASKVATKVAEGLDRLIPEEALLGLLPH
jgi:hypothetical protein